MSSRHWTENARVVYALYPQSSSRHTTIEQCVTGASAHCEQEDIKHSSFEYAHIYMYKSLQLMVQGNVKESHDSHL